MAVPRIAAGSKQVHGQQSLRESVDNLMRCCGFLNDPNRRPDPMQGVGGIAGMHDEGQVPVCETLEDGSGALSAETEIDDRSR